jgi:predicted nucleic acid-binding protein
VTTAFADTVYWIAVVRPNDPWAASANRARRLLGAARVVTTDEVLIEFLTALAGAGERSRQQAAEMVRAMLSHPGVEVIPQARDSFLRGLALYESRPDKNYSMTDCISMDRMRERSISAVLTNDRHFAQEGFAVLMSPNR